MRALPWIAALAAMVFVVMKLRGFGSWRLPKEGEPYAALFAAAERDFDLPHGLLSRVAYQESRFDPNARSPAGAVGIMQIIPRWHPDLGEEGALDPVRAIPYAAGYLRENFERFGSWDLALAAYNRGPTWLARALREGRSVWTWPLETQRYMASIAWDVGVGGLSVA